MFTRQDYLPTDHIVCVGIVHLCVRCVCASIVWVSRHHLIIQCHPNLMALVLVIRETSAEDVLVQNIFFHQLQRWRHTEEIFPQHLKSELSSHPSHSNNRDVVPSPDSSSATAPSKCVCACASVRLYVQTWVSLFVCIKDLWHYNKILYKKRKRYSLCVKTNKADKDSKQLLDASIVLFWIDGMNW